MAYREVLSVEIKEIIRRWQAGLSQRRIAAGTGLSRVTVRRYIEAAGLRPGGPEPGEQHGFLEYARRRGFISDPARVRKPRDKPRVERSVPYVRERLFRGAQFRDLAELRDAARRWCLEVAGQRIHGTTRKRPLAVFEQEERPLLAPWDGEPYEVPDWRTAKVHPDHHVACQYALYSVPAALCPPGQQVELQLGAKLVRSYHRGALLKVHPRQPRGSSRGRCPGPSSGRATSCCASRSATPPPASTPPAAARSKSTSSTCAASNASSSRPSSRRPRRPSPRPRRRAASPAPAPSSH